MARRSLSSPDPEVLAHPVQRRRDGRRDGRRLSDDGLTAKERNFLDLLEQGISLGEPRWLAYQKAHQCSESSAKSGVARALARPAVQAALIARARETLAAGSLSAAHMMVKLAGGAKSEYVRLDASKALLDRVGLPASTANTVMPLGAGGIVINLTLKHAHSSPLLDALARTQSDWNSRTIEAQATPGGGDE